MQQTINVNKVGKQVLSQLEHHNKQVWDAVSFRMIHTLMSKEKELKGSYKKTQEYRKERFKKALKQAKGNKRKAYELISSETFY